MSEPETAQQKAEAAAIRRRWITLGEILAVAAVVISGLTFWNSYQERSSSEAERAAEKQAQSEKAQTLILSASVDRRNLKLAARDPEQAIQGQTIAFPSALGAKAIDTVDPRIEAGWIESAVKKIRDSKSRSGDARLPVAITTRFVSGGESHFDTALYDVGYRLDEGLLDTDVELLGLSLIERGTAKNAQAKLDALWKRRSGA
jgi:predicted negative regulator of RcsB-dependent stress response